MEAKGLIYAAHLIGLPTSIFVFLNISFDSWKGWVLLIITALYGIFNLVRLAVRLYFYIQDKRFEHRLREREARRRQENSDYD